MVEIGLGRGCVALVTEEKVRQMLLQPQNAQIYIDSVKKGKAKLRWRKSQERQERDESKNSKKMEGTWLNATTY